MSRSRYDELHDKYEAILTMKSGTRYERLAAMVFKALEESTAVIHDVSLLGESDVSHQIDVHVTVEGQSRRVLVECKDFDISGDKVGLPIVRNFWAVLDDTRADEGFIITCNGFTDDAAKYAKAKGIKLVVLRIHEEKDWEGFIKTVVVRLLALAPVNPIMTIAVPDDAERHRFASAMQSLHRPEGNWGISLADPLFMVKDQERIYLNEFMTAHMNKAIPLKDAPPDRASVRVANDGWKIEIRGTPPLSFDYVDIAFDVHKHEREIVVTSGRVAELILSGFGDADIIIFGDQLERRKINPDTGEVI